MRAPIAGAVLIGLSLYGSGAASADSPLAPSTGGAPSGPQAVGLQAPSAPQAPPAPIILNMLARPMESQEAAFRESIKQAVRSAEPGPGDGTIRIGGATLSIVVKDPCPDGEPFHDTALVQRPRPGRTRR